MNTDSLFSMHAGRRERLLKRQFQNPLFGDINIEPFDIQEARRADAAEVEAFIIEFKAMVQAVTELKPNADADEILKLKEQLDKAYEASAGLSGDQEELKQMIMRLLGLMMQSMWKAVGNDAQGISKLEMEEQAREAHFRLLETPFIADILAPDSPISETLLLPCLLSEDAQTVALAIHLFEPEQQQLIYQQGQELMSEMASNSSHSRVQQAKQRLEEIAAFIPGVNQQTN